MELSRLRHAVTTLALAGLCWAWAADCQACSCSVVKLDWEEHVVFAGRAVESAIHRSSRDPSDSAGLAVRYIVERSNKLPEGAEVVVFRPFWGTACGGGTHPVGTQGIVVANDEGGVLTTSTCTAFARYGATDLHQRLGLPADYPVAKTETAAPPSCPRPETVSAAFDAADAVGWFDVESACWNADQQRVEWAARARVSWKGLETDEWAIIRSPEYAVRLDQHLDEEIEAATGHVWPPGRFLARQASSGGVKTYLDDGCLNPAIPGEDAVATAIEDLRHLMPIPEPRGRTPRPRWGEVPKLSCTKVTRRDFDDAEARILQHREQRIRELEKRSRPTGSVSPERAGCASCSAARQDAPPWWFVVATGFVAVAWQVRRRRRCQQSPEDGADLHGEPCASWRGAAPASSRSGFEHAGSTPWPELRLDSDAGPGGWVILDEPELRLGDEVEARLCGTSASSWPPLGLRTSRWTRRGGIPASFSAYSAQHPSQRHVRWACSGALSGLLVAGGTAPSDEPQGRPLAEVAIYSWALRVTEGTARASFLSRAGTRDTE